MFDPSLIRCGTSRFSMPKHRQSFRSGLPMAYLVLSCAALHCSALWSVVLCCLTCSCLVMSCAVSCALVWSDPSCAFFLYCFCVIQACCVLFDWSLSCQVWCVISCFVLSALVVVSVSLRLLVAPPLSRFSFSLSP